jgi:hypothetical protein
MAYKNNIPQLTDTIKDSQIDILRNFQDLKKAFEVNHVSILNNNDSDGYHKFVQYIKQSMAPSGGPDEMVLFNILSTITNQQELFTKRTSAIPDITIPITAGPLPSSDMELDKRYVILPRGLLIKYGTVIVDKDVLAGTDEDFLITLATDPKFIDLTFGFACLQGISTVRNTHVYVDYTATDNESLWTSIGNYSSTDIVASTHRMSYFCFGTYDFTVI